ncbi:hypothetical protein [Enterobacter phage ZX14]
MTVKRIFTCYECGKQINRLLQDIITLDDLNYAHVECLMKKK